MRIDSKVVHFKDGVGEHFKLITPKYKYTIEKTIFDLKNLFNGNKQLGISFYFVLINANF